MAATSTVRGKAVITVSATAWLRHFLYRSGLGDVIRNERNPCRSNASQGYITLALPSLRHQHPSGSIFMWSIEPPFIGHTYAPLAMKVKYSLAENWTAVGS